MNTIGLPLSLWINIVAMVFLAEIPLACVAEERVTETQKGRLWDEACLLINTDDSVGLGRLIDVGLDVNDNSTTTSLLHRAAHQGNINCASLLIRRGASIELRDYTGSTPLLNVRNAEVAEILIRAGSGVNVRDNYGMTPLLSAAYIMNDPDLIRTLLAAHAVPDATDSNGATPLMLAAEEGCFECVKVLIEWGAGISLRDNKRRTTLHYAALGSDVGTVAMLAARVELEAKDDSGETPLHYAAFKAFPEVIKELLKFGADIKARDLKGCTPLICLVQGLHKDANMAPEKVRMAEDPIGAAKELIRLGCRTDERDLEGKTALDHLNVTLYPEMASLLSNPGISNTPSK